MPAGLEDRVQTNNCIARAVQSVSLAVIIPLRVGEQRKVDATLHEGTSMAALSPDGRTIAIDLLGRIWTLPDSGGTRPRLAYPLLSRFMIILHWKILSTNPGERAKTCITCV